MESEVISEAYVICQTCKQCHLLFSGLDAPLYWCGNTLYKLKAGDEIEYEGVAS